MATNDPNAQFFSRDAVCCVLRGLTPSSRETRMEVREIKRLLQFNFHNNITMCMHISKVNTYCGVVDAVTFWWLEVTSSHQPSWRGDSLLVTPAPEEALEFFLDHVVAQA